MALIKVPKSIKIKLQSYANHTQKAEKVRLEIEAWFLTIGVNTDIECDDVNGGIITNIIIDTGVDGDIEECISSIEKILNGK